MPMCFQLMAKGQTEPATLSSVDDALRDHFQVPRDPEHWYRGWYNTIGLALAIGHPWDKIKEFFPDKADIIDYLAENYSPDNWKEWK